MKINKQYLLEQHKMNTMKLRRMTPRYIVIHNTANTASARNEALNVYNNNWKRGDAGVSFHFAVDEKEVYQIVRADYNAWHAGDGGTGAGNMSGLGIEIARSRDYSSDNYYKAEENAVKLTAMLMKQFGIPLSNVKRHYDFASDGKRCPHRMFEDNSWGNFIKRVEAEFNGKPAPSKPKPKPQPSGNTYQGYKVGDLIEFSIMHQSHHQDPVVYHAPKNKKGRYYGYIIHLYPKDKYPLAVSATKGGKQMGGVKPVNVYRKNQNDILTGASEPKPTPKPKPKPNKPNLNNKWVGLDITTVAQQVIRGDWYNGEARTKSLKKYGYDPVAVQNEVNRILYGKPKPTKTAKQVAWDILNTNHKWGNGNTRKQRLEKAGYNYNEVQRHINKMLSY